MNHFTGIRRMVGVLILLVATMVVTAACSGAAGQRGATGPAGAPGNRRGADRGEAGLGGRKLHDLNVNTTATRKVIATTSQLQYHLN